MFAYPSTWEETSCNAALEAMAAGLYCIVTNYGALYETCSEYPLYVTYEKDTKRLAAKFAAAIREAIQTLDSPEVFEHLQEQQKFVKKFYSWEKRKVDWTNFLQGVLHERKN
tara:strand:- start:5704 stop:6039 length:336 start_codon:yes stop_codon:yes gene_type:complete